VSVNTSKQHLTSSGDLRYHCFDTVQSAGNGCFQGVRGVKSVKKVLVIKSLVICVSDVL
jgi:hypothetical protein